ncbi:hypothetical protein EF912_19830 [Streptomyces sp. WAC07061]|nr:hypothetical protein EF912_19830 [Streptomyces sp. WAC07061]
MSVGCRRGQSEDGLGFGYPLRVAGEWGFRHPDRPVTWLNTGISGHKVTDLEARWRTDVLDARTDLDPKIQAVRRLARRYGAHLIAADGMFAELSTRTGAGPEYWAADGVHPTPAGHAALAAAWLRLVA